MANSLPWPQERHNRGIAKGRILRWCLERKLYSWEIKFGWLRRRSDQVCLSILSVRYEIVRQRENRYVKVINAEKPGSDCRMDTIKTDFVILLCRIRRWKVYRIQLYESRGGEQAMINDTCRRWSTKAKSVCRLIQRCRYRNAVHPDRKKGM